jgi:hypothetical protein
MLGSALSKAKTTDRAAPALHFFEEDCHDAISLDT